MGRVGAVLCAVCLLASPVSAREDMPHVRGKDAYARWLIEMALTHSPTVRALAAHLASSDIVAYVQVVPVVTRTARTVLLNGNRPIRYLLISIDLNHPPARLVEMLAHELQHAVEIADAPNVRTEAGLVALYRRIGLHRRSTNNFETLLAQQMGLRARQDVQARPAALYARGGSQ
jgi:hypothetical protein